MKSYLSSHVRDRNRNTIYHLLAKGGETTRAELTRVTGISSPTVIKIVDFLKGKGFVEEFGERSTAVGRKPQIIKLNKHAVSAIGVILEGEYIRASVVNLARDAYPSTLRRAGRSLEESINSVIPEMIDSLLAATPIDRSKICGIGLGVPGGYNPITHVVNFAPLVQVNSPVSIEAYERALSDRFSLPVLVDNDVNLAVLGEYQTRELDASDLIYLSLGTGIGAGIMLKGKLRHGNTWQCGEIGYMAFMDDYVPHRSNPGWLESRINLAALREKFQFDPYHMDKDRLEEVIHYVATPIAICISNVVSLLDCSNVVLGGILTQCLGKAFVESVRAKVEDLCVLEVNVEKQISVDPGVVGAASIMLDRAIKRILSEE